MEPVVAKILKRLIKLSNFRKTSVRASAYLLAPIFI